MQQSLKRTLTTTCDRSNNTRTTSRPGRGPAPSLNLTVPPPSEGGDWAWRKFEGVPSWSSSGPNIGQQASEYCGRSASYYSLFTAGCWGQVRSCTRYCHVLVHPFFSAVEDSMCHILQVRKLKPREVKLLVKSHIF